MRKRSVILAISAVIVVLTAVLLFAHTANKDPQTAEAAEIALREANPNLILWPALRAESSDVFAVLFYSEDRSSYKCYYYAKKQPLADFSFRGGRSNHLPLEGIVCFGSPDYDNEVFLSTNLQGICSISIDDGNTVTLQEIDPNQPFLFIFPKNYEIIFLNAEGEIINPDHLTM